MDTQPPFGRLLRFWRHTFALSQEALSLEVGVSARHISFLETGRSKPGKGLIYQLAAAFDLSSRDTSNLLAAGGFFPDRVESDLSAPELRWLRKSVALRLRDLDPVPAWVADSCGRILMVNRGWIHLNRQHLNEFNGALRMNAYHMYFSELGLRSQLLDWEDLACALLVNLQQEVLLTEALQARQVLDELLQYAGIPADWAQRGARVPYAHSFKVRRVNELGQAETFITVNNTVGATPYVAQPRLLLSALHPLQRKQWPEISQLQPLQHSLLYPADQ
jgi:transcriptional regulator with XRE-family HTH domain